MSGSTHAGRTLSRCIVALDAGISISWAMDPDGTYDSGRRHHEREAEEFRQRLDLATPAIEVLFDELETKGRRFLSPAEPAFAERRQTASSRGMPSCELEVASKPRFTPEELEALVARVAALIPAEPLPREAEPQEPPDEPAVPVTKPWWKVW